MADVPAEVDGDTTEAASDPAHALQPSAEYRIALGYAILATTGWIAVAGRQWLYRQRYSEAARGFFEEGNVELGRRATEVAGARLAEVLIAAGLVGVFTLAAVALYRRTWNAWDWASAGVGIASVLSLILLCAAGRVIYAGPFTLVAMWILLYRPGVKRACGVGVTTHGEAQPAAAPEAVALLRQEREQLAGLRQSLQVFELERGMTTDAFVSRYALGIEDQSEDSDEWFELARMATLAEERIAILEQQNSN